MEYFKSKTFILHIINKVLFLFMILFLLASSIRIYAEDNDVSIEDYNGKPIGVLVGPLMEGIADEYFPDSEHLLLNSYADCISALLTNKIDGYLADEPGLKMTIAERPEIDYVKQRLMENKYSFAFKKNDPESKKLCDEFNTFLSKCYEDGTMQQIEDIWFGNDDNKKAVDMSGLGKGRILKVAVTSNDIPFCFIKDGKYVGYDIDLIVRFCKERGYGLELSDVDFAGRIPMIESGKCDFTNDMNVTPEREEQVLFSDPTSHGGVVLAVRSSDLQNSNNSVTKKYNSIDELAGKTVGVLTGAIHDKLLEKRIPSVNLKYFGSIADLTAALESGQIEAYAAPKSNADFIIKENNNLAQIDEHLKDSPLAFAFKKSDEGKKLNEKFSNFILSLKESGKLQELKKEWFEAEESEKELIDYESLPDTNGTLIMATDGTTFPYTYISDNQIVGYEIEIAALFAQEYGYRLHVEKMNFDGILLAVQSEKADFAGSCLAVTDERKESVDFSESHITESVVLVVLKDNKTDNKSFFDNIWNSFSKTFLRENRWKLFVEGIATTTLITLLSVFFGTILGFAIFMLCRNGNTLANTITGISVWLIQGTPMVVLLMLLYYIIFGSIKISGLIVAIIGFTLTFGSSVFGLLKIGVGAIDRGQYEAAYALGHSNLQTFYRIILPQAIPHVLPAYQGEIIGLLKATAVVGYIAVQDLTKMGDIVRSRTYEAFFPLIAVTIIYFILESLFTFVINRIRFVCDPKNRKPEQILKGVDIHD